MAVLVWLASAWWAVALGAKVMTLAQSLWYRHRLWPRLRRRMDPGYRPSVAVLLPVKGRRAGLAATLEALAAQDYPCYRLVCITEAAADPAVAAIAAAVGRHPGRVVHVVAGAATTCAQKNHNLLAGLREHGDAELYLFCDDKVRPGTDWIERMVAPFSLLDPPIATSALCTLRGSLPARVGSLLQQQLSCWQSVALTSLVGGVWGASMALRRTDFEALGLASIWARSIVDDTTVFACLLRRGRRSMMAVLDADPSPAATALTLRGSFEWGVRQCQYVRWCLRRWWWPMLAVTAIGLALPLWPPLLAAAAPGTAWHDLGVVALAAWAAATVLNLAARPAAAATVPWRWWLPLAAVWDLQWLMVVVTAALRRRLSWHDVVYRVAPGGRVTAVARPASAGARRGREAHSTQEGAAA